MSDSEHHWVYVDAREPFDGLIQACPLVIADDGSVEAIMDGLTLITDLDGLKERAWTITKIDNIYEPRTFELVWAAEGHGIREAPDPANP